MSDAALVESVTDSAACDAVSSQPSEASGAAADDMSDPMLTQIEVGPTDAAETTMPGVAQVSTGICCPQCSPSDPDTSGEPAQFASTTSPSSRKAPAFRASPPPVPSTGQGSSSQQWIPTQPKRLLGYAANTRFVP